MSPSGIVISEESTMLVDQSIATLRAVVERIPSGKVDTYIDLQGLLPIFTRYLGRLERNETTLRTKLRFCHLVQMVCSDQPAGAPDRDGLLRNMILESLIEWAAGSMKVSRSRQHVCLNHCSCFRSKRVIIQIKWNGADYKRTLTTPACAPLWSLPDPLCCVRQPVRAVIVCTSSERVCFSDISPT